MDFERIIWDENVYAVIVRGQIPVGKTTFLTDIDEEFQFGVIVGKRTSASREHTHLERIRSIKTTCEALFVRSGECEITIRCDEERFTSRVLKTGDAILLLRGSHGVKYLSDCELLEVKQGPFDPNQDKMLL